MSVLADFEQEARAFIEAAEEILNAPAVMLSLPDAEHMNWLQQVFQCKIGELNAIITDLESGLSIQQIGFGSFEDLKGEIQELQDYIKSLRQQIESLRQVRRR